MPDFHAALTALSPLDGRYAAKVAALAEHFSEFGLIRARVRIEIAWLVALSAEPGISEVPPLRPDVQAELAAAAASFATADAARVKVIERNTNHDVKAVEYWLKERFAAVPEIARVAEFIHFACTSEDINNLAYGLMLADARRDVLLPKLREIAALLWRWRTLPPGRCSRARTARRRRRRPSARSWPTSAPGSSDRSPRSNGFRSRARPTARSATTTRTPPPIPTWTGSASRPSS
jgi:hypothetical protein